MPRGRKKKLKLKVNVKTGTLKSVFAVIFILIGIISFVSFLAPNYSVNEKIQEFLKGMLGISTFLVSFLFVFIGIFFLDSVKWKIKEPRILSGFAFFVFLSAVFAHLFVSADQASKVAHQGGGGGLIGYKFADILRDSISIYGAFILVIGLLIVSLIIMFDISLDQIINFFKELLTSAKSASPKGADLLKKKGRGAKSDDEDIEITSEVPMMSDYDNIRQPAGMPEFKELPFLPSNLLAEQRVRNQ